MCSDFSWFLMLKCFDTISSTDLTVCPLINTQHLLDRTQTKKTNIKHKSCVSLLCRWLRFIDILSIVLGGVDGFNTCDSINAYY